MVGGSVSLRRGTIVISSRFVGTERTTPSLAS